MKKALISLLAVLMAASLFVGCSDGDQETRSKLTASNTVGAVLSNRMASSAASASAASSAPSQTSGVFSDTSAGEKNGSVDIDMTVMSTTMMYSELYLILIDPDSYVGQTIKIKGQYFTSFYKDTNKYYHYVVVSDATACCTQGIEFIWNGDHTYPDDYPKNETMIEVQGVLDIYYEDDYEYCYLAVDEIKILY